MYKDLKKRFEGHAWRDAEVQERFAKLASLHQQGNEFATATLRSFNLMEVSE